MNQIHSNRVDRNITLTNIDNKWYRGGYPDNVYHICF